MGATGIPYCDKTWNPVVGCKGCELPQCWAKDLHNMRHKAYMAGKKLPDMYKYPFSKIQLFPERLDEPLHWKKPRIIFVGSQTDLFGKDVHGGFLDKIFEVVNMCPQHKFLFLTKETKRMAEICQSDPLHYCPDNAWFGATIVSSDDYLCRMEDLIDVPALHRWISFEPLWSGFPQIDFTGINWIVVGSDFNTKRECNIQWVRNLVWRAKAAGVKVFVKQLHIDGKLVKDINQFPEDLRLQESL